MATIQELADRRAQLEDELRKVRQEIAARAGETEEEPVKTMANETPVKTATKKK